MGVNHIRSEAAQGAADPGKHPRIEARSLTQVPHRDFILR
jgi:hypothetical protein